MLVVVAVAVVERQRDTTAPPRPERRGQLVAGDESARWRVRKRSWRSKSSAVALHSRRSWSPSPDARCGGSPGRAPRATSGRGPGRPRPGTARAPSPPVSPRPTAHRLTTIPAPRRVEGYARVSTCLSPSTRSLTAGAHPAPLSPGDRAAGCRGGGALLVAMVAGGLLTYDVELGLMLDRRVRLRRARAARPPAGDRGVDAGGMDRVLALHRAGAAVRHGPARGRLVGARRPGGGIRAPAAGTGGSPCWPRPAARVADAVGGVGERPLAGLARGQGWYVAAAGFFVVVSDDGRSPRNVRIVGLAFVAGALVSVVVGVTGHGGLTTTADAVDLATRQRFSGGAGRPQLPRGRPRGGDRAGAPGCCRRSAIRSPSSDWLPRWRPSRRPSPPPSRVAG